MRTVLVALAVELLSGVAVADDVLHGSEARAHGVPIVYVAPVRVGDPPVVLVRAAVQRQKWEDLRACYRAGLHKNPALHGRVVVEFVVDASGAVTRAGATPGTTLPDASVVECLVHAFGAVRFPRMSGAWTVRYPLELVP